MKKFFIPVALIFIFLGCSDNNDVEVIDNRPKQFITCKIGDDKLEFLYNFDGLSNYYNITNDPLSNELRIIMNSAPDFQESKYLILSIKRIDLDNIVFPWIPNNSASFPNPYSGILLYDNITKKQFSGNQILNDKIYIQLNSFKEDMIEGIFHGEIKSDQGNTLIVKNGEFRVKINKVKL